MRIAILWVLVAFLCSSNPAGAQSADASRGTDLVQAPLAARLQNPPPAPAGAADAGFDVGPIKHLKFSGLLQVWYQGGNEGFVDTFRLRRLRLYVGGDITPRARFLVMVDPSRALAINQERVVVDGTPVLKEIAVNQATRILQDAYIAVRVARHLEVQAGQFKLPMNWEGLAPVQELPLVERSLTITDRARGGLVGDLRDVGVMARGTFDNGLEYRVGVFNGLGTSLKEVDEDDHKAVAARVGYRTPVPGLQVGAFGAWDREVATDLARRRQGVDVRYQRGALTLYGELAGARDGAIDRRGWDATASWRLRPSFEVTARIDAWDPDTRADTSRADAAERDYIGGVTYYVSGNNLRWQAEYLRKTYARGLAPAQHVVLLNLQVAW